MDYVTRTNVTKGRILDVWQRSGKKKNLSLSLFVHAPVSPLQEGRKVGEALVILVTSSDGLNLPARSFVNRTRARLCLPIFFSFFFSFLFSERNIVDSSVYYHASRGFIDNVNTSDKNNSREYFFYREFIRVCMYLRENWEEASKQIRIVWMIWRGAFD